MIFLRTLRIWWGTKSEKGFDKLLSGVFDSVQDLAMTGEVTKCAGGFEEYARYIGPIAFLFNTDYADDAAVQVQVFDVVIFTSSVNWFEGGLDYSFFHGRIDNAQPF